MAPVKHQRIDVNGIDVFYREAGAPRAPVVLLPHGYPCSSYEFRNLMPLLANRYRLLAPDFPGCGYSSTPEGFSYDFDGYAQFLLAFAARVGAEQFVLYLHDFGSQIGLRLAIREPQRIVGLIIQNGDIYEDELGPKYAVIREYWDNPTESMKAKLGEAISEEGYRHEFIGEVSEDIAARISPDLWKLHWSLTTPQRKAIALDVIAGLRENLQWFSRYQEYLRKHQPPTLIVWGPRDGYMPAAAARAYLRDLPNAELSLIEDAGHWLLETHLSEAAALIGNFLWSLSSRATPPYEMRT